MCIYMNIYIYYMYLVFCRKKNDAEQIVGLEVKRIIYVCIYIYVYIYIYTNIYTNAYVYVYICMYIS